MEPITYTNIVVEGVPFTKVLALEIAHAINEHGTAAIVGEMEVDAAREYLNRMDENAAIKITTTAEGQLSVFSCVASSLQRDSFRYYFMDCLPMLVLSRRQSMQL